MGRECEWKGSGISLHGHSCRPGGVVATQYTHYKQQCELCLLTSVYLSIFFLSRVMFCSRLYYIHVTNSNKKYLEF